MPLPLSPFIPDLPIKRSEIHKQYGGSSQSGIAPCANFPFIFIFTGASGLKHGYDDNWLNKDVFSYTGQGQIGDMRYISGNLALKNHLDNGKRVFLFEYLPKVKGFVKFVSELEFIDTDYFETPDREGNKRVGIKFFFKRKGIYLPAEAHPFIGELQFAEPVSLYLLNKPNETERKGLVTSRVGQGAYRKQIIHRWEYHCAVTGFNKPEILIASHIKPWKDSSDDERLDVHNGILLSPVYDALFDKHLISFENAGKIILSDQIEYGAYEKIGVTGNEIIRKLNSENHGYLAEHRERMGK
ncbi:MAG: HNH endonuclease [Bacteroidota bacterium]|nr:HNH endonuclease [Bacteroidota bacterium]